MEDYLGRGEDVVEQVGELETCLVALSAVAGVIAALAKNACDEGGYRRLVHQEERRQCGDSRQALCGLAVESGQFDPRKTSQTSAPLLFYLPQRRVHFEVAEPFHTITAFFLGSEWSCFFFALCVKMPG